MAINLFFIITIFSLILLGLITHPRTILCFFNLDQIYFIFWLLAFFNLTENSNSFSTMNENI